MISNYDDDSPTQPVPVLRPGPQLAQAEAVSRVISPSPGETGDGQPDLPGLSIEGQPRVQFGASPQADEFNLGTTPWTTSSLASAPDQPQLGPVRQIADRDASTPTPRPMPVLRPDTARARSLTALLALVIAGMSLALNLIVVTKLLQVRSQVDGALSSAIAQLETVCDPGSTPLTFPISQTIRFQGNIPMPQGLVIPFKGNIPFRTTIRVETFPGGPVINVPINTVVPVDTQVPIPGNIVIPVDTSIPFRQDIPIDLCTEASPFHGLVDQLENELRTLQDGF